MKTIPGRIRHDDFCPHCGTEFKHAATRIHYRKGWVELDGTITSEPLLLITCRCGHEMERLPMSAHPLDDCS